MIRLVRARQQAVRWTRRLARAAVVVGILGAAPPPIALAAAPSNDNYLASTIMRTPQGGFPSAFTATVDTNEATTQNDLFQPDKDGAPLGGGPPEPLLCGGSTVGKTVWFDFSPPIDGGVEISAQGFDTTVAVWRYDTRTSALDKLLGCSASPGVGESFVVPNRVLKGKSYTVQVGGAVTNGVAASGLLSYGFNFYGDRDGDGVLDAQPDRCPDLLGVADFGGCPPALQPSVNFNFDRSGSGVRLTRFVVNKLPSGASIRVSAGGRVVTAKATGKAQRLVRLEGVSLRGGSTLSVRATMSRRGKTRYRFGAIGSVYTYKVRGGRVGTRTERCLVPGSAKPRKSCRKP
ncbi:MAG: hypothetical protein J7513_13935 [Solirubrobacteraceae bacterium]|nr:hypothetical protein [Solirubrobacteraceae bacterium]